MHDDFVTWLETIITAGNHRTGKIDSRDMRIGLYQTTQAIETQTILIVDRRILNSDVNLTILGQPVLGNLLNIC